ncbi:transposase [Flavobacterium kingsejongi]|uniref:transposase n=1 Tax=Flavobacterium kingsejongi TaxID=1678728 RepID=UPI000EB5EC6F|nr:transposase [Flavobacterium kingsejongi]
MKQIRKIYDKSFKEKAVELSYDRTNVSELARELGITAPSFIIRFIKPKKKSL